MAGDNMMIRRKALAALIDDYVECAFRSMARKCFLCRKKDFVNNMVLINWHEALRLGVLGSAANMHGNYEPQIYFHEECLLKAGLAKCNGAAGFHRILPERKVGHYLGTQPQFREEWITHERNIV